MIIVKEVGENKTLHLQGYIEFAKRITFIKFIKILGRNFHAERVSKGKLLSTVKNFRKTKTGENK